VSVTRVHGDALLEALSQGVEVYDLGRSLFAGVPQSPHHPDFRLVLPRRHGDRVRSDGSSGANDLLITGSHVGTHIDALCHISHRGLLHGGIDAAQAQSNVGFLQLGIETVEPIVSRGLLLDVARVLGVDCCAPDYEVTVDDLEAALGLTGVTPVPGDVLLVHTGWGRHFDDRERFEGTSTGTPGPGESGARWLAEQRPRAVGGESIPFERVPPDDADFLLPGHRVLLVEHGIHIIEVLDLDRLAAERRYEFTFVLSPLKIVGATGSPARPLALVAAAAKSDGAGPVTVAAEQ
jgi:kynurenine formamidase